MIAEYKKKSNYSLLVFLATFLISIVAGFIGLGQILQGNQTFFNNPLFTVLGWVSYISLFVGIFYLAKVKGYSGWYALLGFLFLLGLLIMFVLKDKTNPANKNKSNKLVIVLILIFAIIIALGALSKLALKEIDPLSKLTEAKVASCTSQCNTKGNNSNKCVITCLEEGKLIEPGGKCSTLCADTQNVGQCITDCIQPKISPSY